MPIPTSLRSRRLARLVAAAALLSGAAGPSTASAAVSCPNSNPVVNENNCTGAGTSAYQLTNQSDSLAGYSTKTSFNLGQDVPLKIARGAPVFPATRVNIAVYRTGYYGGFGARLIPAAGSNNVAVNNSMACNTPVVTTGEYDCGNWSLTYTIPGASLPATGVYVAKLTATDTGIQNWITFVVRDDNRAAPSKIIDVLPTASWQAYNNWGGKSLYFDKLGGANTVAGTDRAVKVSFNRPLDAPERVLNRYFGSDFALVSWMERQGYDVSYSDDAAVHGDGAQLRKHKIVAISGHSEYWSLEEFDAVKAARDAGVNVASISANTAYWKVRYENGDRRLVCYKTVEGSGSGGNGTVSANDWGPDGIQGTADDALGADGVAGTADDKPQNSTTTFRDNGASPGDPNAPTGGRVGPDLPENSLFGVMYVGDNDSLDYPLTIPAANANGEFAGDRAWRNTGISTNVPNTIGTAVVGWEWDAVPTQAQYLTRQPSGVKRLSASNTTAGTPSWLLDEGRLRSTSPPPGQPGTVNAVTYRAASGATVFAAGTNIWPMNLDNPKLAQATYNIFSDMAVQPATPDGITPDPGGSNSAPTAAFSVTPASNPVPLNQAIQFNAGASSDSDGTIVKYEWDLDGNGTFETNTGTTKTTSRTYTAEGSYDVRLRVTDNGGATDLTVRTVDVLGNQPPTAAFTMSPNPAVVTQTVNFNAAGSADPDGTIAKYEWDLDGNGTYETDRGTSTTATKAYTSTGTLAIQLRVTDNGGKTATSTLPLTINAGGVSNYGDAVMSTPGLLNYWRLGEQSGTTLADSKGTNPATRTATGVTLGVPGGPAADPNTAARFDGLSGAATAQLNLSSTSKLTVEFWLNWNQYANNDSLAMEFTSNFNDVPGGFLIDPNAPQQGGSFGVALGDGATRNNVFFTRPSAAQWHHYAFVLDTTAPAATQITPYVDGVAVPYTKTASGAVTGTFANAALNFMSRNGNALLGAGDLDEVAIYDRPVSAAKISEHAASYGANRRPTARFTLPASAQTGQQVTFNGSSSSDLDGQITRYEWDLDGNGTYETDGGTSPTRTTTYSANQTVEVGLKVTDNQFGTDTTSHTLLVGNAPPTVSFTANPNPTIVDNTVSFDAAGSADPDGTITKYEWDLDGNGTYETDTGTTKTSSRSYASTGTVAVGLRLTDNGGATATGTVPVTINSGGVSNYGDAVLATTGLKDYWRMGEASGTTLADSQGASPVALAGGATLGVPGGVAGDPNTAVRFDGVNDSGQASLNLSGTSQVTVEFWLKWNQYANNDALAMEFTPNFNDISGGFLVDPNAAAGQFGIGIGSGASRNNVYFARPSAGQWHHYALVLDATAPGATAITPYVDGQSVAYTKTHSGTGAGPFANSTLYLMSRAGSGLFGAGDLDEPAIYDRALTGGVINEHFSSSGTNRRPHAAFTVSPNPVRPGQTASFDASTSSDPDGTIARYQWDLDGNGSFETDSGAVSHVTKTYASSQNVTVKLRVLDNQGGTDSTSHALTVGNAAPNAALTANPNPSIVGQVVAFDASASSDPDGTIAKYEWDLDGNGSYETDTGTTKTSSRSYASPGTVAVGLRVTDNDGTTATATLPVTTNSGGVSNYGDTVLDTTGLKDYWRMGEASGTTLADSQGASPVALAGGATLGVPGGVAGDPNTAVRFDGVNDSGSASLNLSGTSQVTVEFWLKWNQFANNDSLAMEFTSNFNGGPGGFLVDPNADSGQFGIGMGQGASRNNVFFARPSAGQWHHYALVLDATAPAATAITPYVDGQSVTYTKTASGTGAGPFANSTLYLMSRAGAALFGAGDLDEVAVYDRALGSSTISEHVASNGTNRRPRAAFTMSPSPAKTGQTVTFNGAGSSDPDGTIARYQWDLDGNGSYETDSGSTPTATKSYTADGDLTVGLRVIDNAGGTDTQVNVLSIGNRAPTAAFTATPNPAGVGQAVSFNAAGSSDPDGTIAKYEWDRDGNGSYETDTGTTATTTSSYASAGNVTVGLRVTDNDGGTATATKVVSVKDASYSDTVLATTGLRDYWRMGEISGTTLADSAGTSTATVSGGTLGAAGAIDGDTNSAVGFNGTSSYARAQVNLSQTSAVTVEFWLKWDAWANNDALALEFTDNFNSFGGGFLVDPNASNGYFGVALGQGGARNTAYFSRPSAGQWHHYVLVLDGTAAGANQVTPYVDGQPVTYFKGDSGTGAGPFANANLSFMSRAGAGLFGAGVLDELAIYDRAVSATTVTQHYAAGTP